MASKITREQRTAVLQLLAQGDDRDTIAAAIGITPGQVSAIAAHVTMGTYTLPNPDEAASSDAISASGGKSLGLLQRIRDREGTAHPEQHLRPVLLGSDVETAEEVFWNPDPNTGAANPHVLVLGESRFG